MKKNIICVECPNGCLLDVEFNEGYVISVLGNQCEKGEGYAKTEIENPLRILTSTVMTEDLHMKWVPVRTDKPIPKNRLFEAMKELKKVRIKSAMDAGDVVVEDFLGLGVHLVATRKCR